MKNPLKEQQIIPYHKSPPYGERILVIAPHPDDETLGCGGTIRLLVESEKEVKAVFLTSGDKADPSHPASQITHDEKHITDYSLMREKEAEEALRILGVSDHEFLRFPDRELFENHRDVLKSLLKITGDYMPDTIYSPSPAELNPDHRTAADISFKILQKAEKLNTASLKVIFYEITTPLRPNMLVDVTPVYKVKNLAIKEYRSQLKLIDYQRHITALNTFRSLTLGDSEHYAEAFWALESLFTEEDAAGWLSYREGIKISR